MAITTIDDDILKVIKNNDFKQGDWDYEQLMKVNDKLNEMEVETKHHKDNFLRGVFGGFCASLAVMCFIAVIIGS